MSVRSRGLRLLTVTSAGLAGLDAYAWYAVRRFEDLDPVSAGAPGAFVEVDGVRIHYVEAGRGEPVLLIHGLNASTFSFRYTISELARHYRVVAVDRMGCGFSDRPAGGDYSLTAQATLLARVMDQLAIERAAVVGHSLGGAVAMRLTLAYPERVSRLVLVDSATDREMHFGALPATYLRHLLPIASLFALQRAWFRRLSLRSAVHDPAHLTPEVLDGYFRTSRMKGHLRALGLLFAHGRRDGPLAFERIRQPTLILWGEHDRWLPPDRGEELERRIPDARLLLIRSAGHLPLEEQPDSCNQALLEFLRSSEPAAEPVPSEPAQKLETPG
jgi:pimeloyl-ACP methyl ester carboxylesterase